MIHLEDIRFSYPNREFALQVNALHVDHGQTVAITGPSGSGKTTLLSLIAGVLLPSSGRVTVNGTDVTALDDRRRRDLRIRQIGMVFQEFELLEYLNVLDNILLPYRITPALRLDRHVRDRAKDLARQVGIEDKLRRNASRLSQGERQRVAVCRALLTEPDLLLCDEPTGNLDPANKQHVLDILFDHVARHGTTLVTVTHDHDLLPRFERVTDTKTFYGNGASAAHG